MSRCLANVTNVGVALGIQIDYAIDEELYFKATISYPLRFRKAHQALLQNPSVHAMQGREGLASGSGDTGDSDFFLFSESP
jgi:hypothetical protein